MGIKVSVITINLNNLEGLKRTFESVINQDFSEIEFLLIDGNSTDGSKEFIVVNSENFFFWQSEKDQGIYDAMNMGIKKSTGDYLIFLNSGDFFCEFDSLSKLISNSQGEDIVYGNLLIQEPEKVWIKKYPERLNFRYLYFDSLPHPASLISRDLFDQYGLYDTSLKLASDWKFFLFAIVKYNCSYKYVDHVISTFYYDGVSSKKENIKFLNNERTDTLKKYFKIYFLFYSFYLKLRGKSVY